MNRLLLALLALLTGLTVHVAPAEARQGDAVVAMATVSPAAVQARHGVLRPLVRWQSRAFVTVAHPARHTPAFAAIRIGIDRARE